MTGHFLFLCGLAAATVSDLWKRRIPDTVHVLFLLSGLIQITGCRQPFLPRVMAFLLIGGVMLGVGIHTGSLGGGDIKMGACMSFALGLIPALYSLLLAFFLAALLAAAMRLLQAKPVSIPLAPFMALGCLAVFAVL